MALPAHPLRKESIRPVSTPAPALKVVQPPRPQRTRVPFLVLCLGILMGAMLGALVLNTVMASTAYDMHSTQLELARTQQANEERAAEVDRLAAPARVTQKARSLGMVPGEAVVYLDLATGEFIGADPDSAKDS